MSVEHPWSGIIGVEGRRSVDGRLIHSSGLAWKTMPIPLIGDGWKIIGRVETIERVPADGEDGVHLLRATGVSYHAPLSPGASIAMTCSELQPDRRQGAEIDFRSGTVRAVYVGSTPAWPECMID